MPAFVVVGGGKGGVGKTTVSLALARGLRRLGLHVGLVDADLSGPNIDVALTGAPLEAGIGTVMVEGLSVLCPSGLHAFDEPLVHSGYAIRGQLEHAFAEEHWLGVDVVVVDAPPGTTRVHAELLDMLEVSCWVVVTTGSPLAVVDAVRFVRMVREADVDLLGAVANLTRATCDDCGARVPLFPSGEIEEALQVSVLDELAFQSGVEQASVPILTQALCDWMERRA